MNALDLAAHATEAWASYPGAFTFVNAAPVAGLRRVVGTSEDGLVEMELLLQPPPPGLATPIVFRVEVREVLPYSGYGASLAEASLQMTLPHWLEREALAWRAQALERLAEQPPRRASVTAEPAGGGWAEMRYDPAQHLLTTIVESAFYARAVVTGGSVVAA